MSGGDYQASAGTGGIYLLLYAAIHSIMTLLFLLPGREKRALEPYR